MAQDAFLEFYRNLNRRCGKRIPRHDSYDREDKPSRDAFLEIGRLCATEGWEPQEIVGMLLDIIKKKLLYILPKDMVRSEVLDGLRTRLIRGQHVTNPLKEWLYCEARLFEFMDLSQGITETVILVNPMMPFPAWFRVLYPEKIDDKIFEYWGDPAHKMFLMSKPLRKFARVQAPKTFAQLEARWGRFGEVEVIPHD